MPGRGWASDCAGALMSYEPHQSPLPHPSRIVPKVVMLVFFAMAFGNLVRHLVTEPEHPHPVRVGLVHAEKGSDPVELLRSGLVLPSPLELAQTPRAARLDQPLGSEHAALTYNARPFREVGHLGEDLNGIGGEDSDLGDPVFAVGSGRVAYAADASEKWGKIVILQHRHADGGQFQTLYAHLDAMHVTVGDFVNRGQQIGSVGTGNGNYLAHLHFEMRQSTNLDVGGGYSPLTLDRLPAEQTVALERGAPDHLLNRSLRELTNWRDPERGVELGRKAGLLRLKNAAGEENAENGENAD